MTPKEREDLLVEVQRALAKLERAAARERAPKRHDARALLLPLGALISAGEEDAAAGLIERARTALSALGEAWREAADEEIRLAAAEHVRSVDPRYLAHPRFDLGYVREARARLEMRLAALEQLDFPLERVLLERIDAADRLLAEHFDDPADGSE